MKSTDVKKLKTRAILVVSAFVVSYVCSWLFQHTFEGWNTQIVDRLFVFRSLKKSPHGLQPNEVVHVDANFYVNRAHHAQVIRNLASMNVSAQVIDFVFADEIGAEEDRPLIEATLAAGTVYFGMSFDLLEEQNSEREVALKAAGIEYLNHTKWKLKAEGDPAKFYVGTNPKITFSALASASRGLGYLNLIPEKDGILRRLPLLVRYGNGFYPSIVLRAVCDYFGVDQEKIIVTPGESIRLKEAQRSNESTPHDIVIPIDEHGNMLLNRTDSWEQLKHYSYSEIFQASEDHARLEKLKKALSGKIVLISETVDKQFDVRPTGSGNKFASGEIHALAIQNILSESFLKDLSRPLMLLVELAVLAALFLLSFRFSSFALSLGTLALAGLFSGFGVFAFLKANIIFEFIRPLMIMAWALGCILVSNAIEKAILFAETEKARRIAEHELEIGRQIQAGFFPTRLPTPDGWELVAHFQAARHVAGDFYDAFYVGDNEKKIGIVIADVCDKGVGAALFMALFRSLIRVLSGSTNNDDHLEYNRFSGEPDQTLLRTIRSINNYISNTHEQDGMFATIFFGILDPESGVLYYINGGHEPPVVIGTNGIKTQLDPTGPAVGMFADSNFQVCKIQLEVGDILLAFTDGVVDAQNQAGDIFSKTRFFNQLTKPYSSAKTLVNHISTQLNNHVHGEAQFDDITLLALRWMK